MERAYNYKSQLCRVPWWCYWHSLCSWRLPTRAPCAQGASSEAARAAKPTWCTKARPCNPSVKNATTLSWWKATRSWSWRMLFRGSYCGCSARSARSAYATSLVRCPSASASDDTGWITRICTALVEECRLSY